MTLAGCRRKLFAKADEVRYALDPAGDCLHEIAAWNGWQSLERCRRARHMAAIHHYCGQRLSASRPASVRS